MQTAHLADLENLMERWINDHCEDINTYWGDRTAQLMARAAASVVDSMVDVCKVLQKEKLIKS